jgi:hypothetical protein
MINLLPEKEKQELFFEKKKRLAIILGSTGLIVLICLILILLSIRFYLLTEVDAQKNILKDIESQKTFLGYEDYKSIVENKNNMLSQLDIFYTNQIYFYDALNILLNISKPENLNFTNFSLNEDDNNIINISVSGVSDSRDSLISFKDNIEQTKEIKNPIFSSASWISPKNVKFSLIFQIDKNEQ